MHNIAIDVPTAAGPRYVLFAYPAPRSWCILCRVYAAVGSVSDFANLVSPTCMSPAQSESENEAAEERNVRETVITTRPGMHR